MKFEIDKARCEKKFVVNLRDYEIENIIKHHPAMFSEIDFHGRKRNTKQNSIYLDSFDLNDFHDHTTGISPRIKMRIRWYKNLFGLIEKPKLEVKIKCNEFRNKLLFPLKPFVLNKNFSLAYLQKEVFAKSNLPGWLIERLKLSEMSLLTSYRRKYFLSANKKFRINIDTDLRFFRIDSRNNLFNEKIKQDYSIIELKFDEKDYEDADKITENLPFRLAAYSKYVSGINLLEL